MGLDDGLIRWRHFRLWTKRGHGKQLSTANVTPSALMKVVSTERCRQPGFCALIAMANAICTASRLGDLPWERVEELLEEQVVITEALV